MEGQLKEYNRAALREASLIAADVTYMILSRCSSVVNDETTSTFAGGSDSYHAYFGEPAGLGQLRAIPEELAAYCRQGAYEASLDERSAALRELEIALHALQGGGSGSSSLRGAHVQAGPVSGSGAAEPGPVEQVGGVTIANFQLAVFEAVASLRYGDTDGKVLERVQHAYGRVLYYRSLSALLASEAYATEGSVDTAVYLWGQGMVAMPLPNHEIASAAAENFLDSIRLSLDISPDNYAIGSDAHDDGGASVDAGVDAGESAGGGAGADPDPSTGDAGFDIVREVHGAHVGEKDDSQPQMPGSTEEDKRYAGGGASAAAAQDGLRFVDQRSLGGVARRNRHGTDHAMVAKAGSDLNVLDSIVHSAKYLERAGKAMVMLRATTGRFNTHLNHKDAHDGMTAAAVQRALKCAADASSGTAACDLIEILLEVLFDSYSPPEGDKGAGQQDRATDPGAARLFKALQPGLSLLWHLSRTEVAGVRLYAPVAKILTDMYKKRHPFADLSREDRGRVLCGQWAAADFDRDDEVYIYPRVLRSGTTQTAGVSYAKQLLPFGCAGAAHTSYYTSLVTLVTTMVRLGAANTLEQLGYMPSNGIEAAKAAGGSAGGDGRDAEHPSGLCEPRTINEAVRFPAECMFERLRPPAPTPTSTPTPTPTPTTTPSSSATPSGTPSCTPSPSETPSSSPTPSVTPSPSAASDGCCTIS